MAFVPLFNLPRGLEPYLRRRLQQPSIPVFYCFSMRRLWPKS